MSLYTDDCGGNLLRTVSTYFLLSLYIRQLSASLALRQYPLRLYLTFLLHSAPWAYIFILL